MTADVVLSPLSTLPACASLALSRYAGVLVNFAIRELHHVDDPAFWDAMELYVETFPRDEREPISSYVRSLQKRPQSEPLDATMSHLLVVEDESRNVLGMRFCQASPQVEIGFLVYVAVDTRYRRFGLGTRLINTALKLCEADMAAHGKNLLGACFEVERVELATSNEDRNARLQRLKFFQSLGAEVVSTTYVQPALAEDKEPVPLYLMAHQLNPSADRSKVTYNFCTTFLGMEEGQAELVESLRGAASQIDLASLIRSFE